MLKHTPPLVLVVDDEDYFREIFSLKLRSLGFTVEAAESADSGVAQTIALDPDLVLMDVQMPGKNGIEGVEDLKKNEKTRNVKVVFLTSLGELKPESQQTNTRFAQEVGADGYLRKTDDIDALCAKIRAFID